MQKTCVTCIFNVPQSERNAFCHRSPPAITGIFETGGSRTSSFTVVDPDATWCGDYRRDNRVRRFWHWLTGRAP